MGSQEVPERISHTLPLSAWKRRRRVWITIAVSTFLTAVILGIAMDVMLERAGPILKGRVIETLSTRFDSRVEMEDFHISVLQGFEVTGDRLRIYLPEDVIAAGAREPLIALEHFSFHTGLMGLLLSWTLPIKRHSKAPRLNV
jgi:hypothetical protein